MVATPVPVEAVLADVNAEIGLFNDSRIIRRFGNLTATSTNEVLVSARPYNAQSAEGQRSVKSSSVNDANPAGTGAKIVRILYLTSTYAFQYEDVELNGTTAVPTVNADIMLIEDYFVIKGAAAAGNIELFSANDGTGTAICGIPTGSTESLLCHHYVPAGKRAWVLDWGATVDDEADMKLDGQDREDGVNLVDRVLDLDKLAGITTPPGRVDFKRELLAALLPEKTYCRVTVAPLQATSTVIRARMNIWQLDAST